MPLPMPEQFGRYRILKLLGQGGMGAVYLARDSLLERDVALKIPSLDGPDSAQMVERFSREARAAAALQHPNICPVFDVGEIDGKPYLTMRYIEGRPLTKFINPERPQNPRNVAVVIRKLALALAEAHRQGVVHRDLKPANVMIDAKNEPIVMDFGLARQLGGANEKQVTQSGMIIGTPAYMSPEQIAADPAAIDHRTDIWSLGVILFEMLSGQLPYDGNVAQIIGAIQYVDPPLVSDKRPALPEKITEICRKMMTRDKAQRYQSMNDAAAELAAFLKDPAAGTLTAGAGSTSDGALQSMAIPRTGHEPHTETPRSLAEFLATGPMPKSTSVNTAANAKPRDDAGALATLMQSIVRTSSALLRGRRKPNNTKGSGAKNRANRWTKPAAAAAGVLLLIGVIYATSGRNGKPPANANAGTQTSVAASVPRPSSLDPRPAGWHGWPPDAPKPAIAPFDAAQAKKHQEEWAAYLKVPVEYENTIGMKFRLIPPGEFVMGGLSEEHQAKKSNVILTTPFYLAIQEVTQGVYEKVIGNNPSLFSKTGNWKEYENALLNTDTSLHPVENISWYDAAEFCSVLSRNDLLEPFYSRTGNNVVFRNGSGYRLPTEAEWEFACRAGSTSVYFFGDADEQLQEYAWYGTTSVGHPHPAGQLRVNQFGIFDISGNVFEWIQDLWGPSDNESDKDEQHIDPTGPRLTAGISRIIRGGCWRDASLMCQCARRLVVDGHAHGTDVGMRIVLTVDSVRLKWSNTTPAQKALEINDQVRDRTNTIDQVSNASASQERYAADLKLPVEYENFIGMKFRLIPPGEFLMGSTPDEIQAAIDASKPDDSSEHEWIRSEAPQHRVKLTEAFYLGVHELTQQQYSAVMDTNPSYFRSNGPMRDKIANQDSRRYPVDSLSWDDAIEFCRRLNVNQNLPDYTALPNSDGNPIARGGYSLPTEAQWEYACRAGTATRYSSGDTISNLREFAWTGFGLPGSTHEVGILKANSFGLHDMHGNVSEWALDCWELGDYKQRTAPTTIDPLMLSLNLPKRIRRGGNFFHVEMKSRSAVRVSMDHAFRDNTVGMRVALRTEAVRELLKREGGTKPGTAGQPATPTAGTTVSNILSGTAPTLREMKADYTNSIGMKLVRIPAGEFRRGSPDSDDAAETDEKPSHRVRISQPFYLARTEVTQSEWQSVMGKNPSLTRFGGMDLSRFPVENVSWYDVIEFCIRLSEKEKLPPYYKLENVQRINEAINTAAVTILDRNGRGYRLPTEAEWEYSCRAGTTTRFHFGDLSNGNESNVMGFDPLNVTTRGPTLGRTTTVGSYAENSFGLVDMHGNVWEWCQDIYGKDTYLAFKTITAIDPLKNRGDQSPRILRGGSRLDYPRNTRSAYRYSQPPENRFNNIGFRPARNP